MSAARSAWLLAAVAFVVAAPARAHVPIVHGRLLDLVQRSEVIVIGTVQRLSPAGNRADDLTVHVERVLTGRTRRHVLTVRAPSGLAHGERYVFFVRHGAAGAFDSVASSGTVFPARVADDLTYERTVTAIAAALRRSSGQRVTALRAALIPALGAAAAPLRYHAGLELAALSHEGHPLSTGERTRLQRVQQDPATDPALLPLLAAALKPQ